MADVFLGLGSNLGERENNVKRAMLLLEETGEIRIKEFSSFYEGEPIGVSSQTNFVNCVVLVETELDPHSLLKFTKAIETDMGRKPNTHFRPRPIDIDILIYDDIDLESLDLMIPHSRLKTRRFVLEPLLEIAPEIMDPVSGKPLREFLDDVNAQSLKKLIDRKEVRNVPGRSS